jgi:hypothetical protein
VGDIDGSGVFDRVARGMVQDSGESCNRAKESVVVSACTLLDDEIIATSGISREKTQFVITNPRVWRPPARVNAVPKPLKIQ